MIGDTRTPLLSGLGKADLVHFMRKKKKSSHKGPQYLATVDKIIKCQNCYKNQSNMSAVPMGQFAAFKVREKLNAEEDEKGRSSYSSASKITPINQDSFDNPTKYTSKAMMAIWGMYNRYSVHNFKSSITSVNKLN